MANIDFQKVLNGLKDEVAGLAMQTLNNYANEAKADGLQLVESLKTDIISWGKELIEGKMTKDDVEFLVLGKKELIQMNALKQAGLGLVKVDQFKNSLLQLIIKTITGLI